MTDPIIAISRRGAPVQPQDGPCAAWWSLTKTVLSAATFRLAERGQLDLTKPLAPNPFTPLHLLRNTSGVPNYTDLPRYRIAVEHRQHPWPDADLLARVGPTLNFAPGTDWAYSNTGYMHIRRLIEQVTDMPIDEAIAALVFVPIGLENTRIALDLTDIAACTWLAETDYHPGWVYHSMAIGPASDAVLFLDALFQSHFLSAAFHTEFMHTTDLGAGPKGRPWLTAAYGAGLMAGRTSLGRAWGHSGAGPYSVSAAYHFPDMPDSPTVCAFTAGSDESVPEWLIHDLLNTNNT